MVRIAICDDEETLILDLKEQLDRYGRETGRELCLLEYHDGSELLAHYQPDLDLIFMDIRMEKVNGLKAAEEIRKVDSTVGIMFLTSLSQYVWKGYEYGAVNYLLKPVKYGRLKMCIRDRCVAVIPASIRIQHIQHGAVAGDLTVPSHGFLCEQDQGIEPVENAGQKKQIVEKIVPVAIVLQFVEQHVTLSLIHI